MSVELKLRSDDIDSVMGFLKEEITEERTDALIDRILDGIKLPFWFPKFIVKKALDRMLPEKIFEAIDYVLRKIEREA